MTRESNIIHEAGAFWVCDADGQFTVYMDGLTHAKSDSSYPGTDDGKSLAIARCDYLNRRYPSELTPIGEQLVIPGCERRAAPGKAQQLGLWG